MKTDEKKEKQMKDSGSEDGICQVKVRKKVGKKVRK